MEEEPLSFKDDKRYIEKCPWGTIDPIWEKS